MLILEDGRKHATFSAYYALLFQERQKNAIDMPKKIYAAYGEGTVTERMVKSGL